MHERESILTADEIDGVLAALSEGQGAAGATVAEGEEALRWARKARINSALINLVLDKRVAIGDSERRGS